MKYKLYCINRNEIRGLRYYYQYHLLPKNAEWIKKEFDSEKDGIPELFFIEDGKRINFTKYKANANLTDIIQITPLELESNPGYIKEKNRKLFLDEEIKQIEIDKKKDRIARLKRLKDRVPSFIKIVDEEISELEK